MIAIIIQGPDTYHDELYNHYITNLKIKDIIFSTWEGSKSRFPITIKSPKPDVPGYGNSNLQFYGTCAGTTLAKTLGYKYAVKIRPDFLINDVDKFLSIIDKDKMSFLAYHNWNGGYLIDYIIGAPVDLLISIMNEDTSLSPDFAERQLFQRIKKHNVTEVNYLLPKMKQQGITCRSLKWGSEVVETGALDALYCYPKNIIDGN